MSLRYTLSIFAENSPGVLHRITVMFTRRKINIESLTVSETERHGISRFTIVVDLASKELVETVVKQLHRIIEVTEVYASENQQLVFKEIAFLRVASPSREKRLELEELAHRYGSTITYAHSDYLILEKTGTEDEISSLYLLFEPFGIKEFIRSGRIAMLKEIICN